MAKKRGPDNFVSRLFTRHRDLRKIEGMRAREMARTMRDVKDRALGLIKRNMTTFREAGEYIDSAAAVARAEQTVAGIDTLMAQRGDWATSNVLSMRKEAWGQGVSDIQFAAERLPTGIEAQMQASFGQVFPEAAFSAIEHPVLGVGPEAMFNGVRAGTTQNMRNILVNAVVSGESVQETGRRISDSLDISVAAGERIARTNVNAAYNEAQRAVYDANSDIIAGYTWEATLDDRTSQVCFMLHGQFWPTGSKTPGPPAHWNCRSILLPVFKDPTVQAVLDGTPRRARQYNKKGEMRDILVKGTTTPEQWARRQPPEITLRITGSKLKNSLFRRKLIGFNDLVDPSLRVLTNQEIIKRATALHPGNAALQKLARSMGIKTIPSPATIRKADSALAAKQPWRPPEDVPTDIAQVEPPPPIPTVERTYAAFYNEWIGTLNEEELSTIAEWKRSKDFVEAVRRSEAGEFVGAEAREKINVLHRALGTAPSRDQVLFRGLGLEDEELRLIRQSKTIPFKSSASGSRLESRARGFAEEASEFGEQNKVVLNLRSKSSVDITDIGGVNQVEQEQIIQRGTEFKILRVEERGDFTYIFAEEI